MSFESHCTPMSMKDSRAEVFLRVEKIIVRREVMAMQVGPKGGLMLHYLRWVLFPDLVRAGQQPRKTEISVNQ